MASLSAKATGAALLSCKGFRDARQIVLPGRPKISPSNHQAGNGFYDRVRRDRRARAGRSAQPGASARSPSVRLRNANACAATHQSIAIVFMHAIATAHEKAVAKLSRAAGFPSSRVQPEGLAADQTCRRVETTVIDAYLSPILRAMWRSRGRTRCRAASGARADVHDVVWRVDGEPSFPGQTRSSPATPAASFGWPRTVRRSGISAPIGFDMGGTSTDVSHFDGEYERPSIPRSRACACLRADDLITRSAAGGGSIRKFDGSRFRVVPDSAAPTRPESAKTAATWPLDLHRRERDAGKAHPRFPFRRFFGAEADEGSTTNRTYGVHGLLAKEIGGGPKSRGKWLSGFHHHRRREQATPAASRHILPLTSRRRAGGLSLIARALFCCRASPRLCGYVRATALNCWRGWGAAATTLPIRRRSRHRTGLTSVFPPRLPLGLRMGSPIRATRTQAIEDRTAKR